jgi:hypothetical protein
MVPGVLVRELEVDCIQRKAHVALDHDKLVAVMGRCFDIDMARSSSTSSARKAG